MRTWTSLAASIYGRLLSLYPQEFQEEFRGEMLEVFSQGIGSRDEGRPKSPCLFLLRELRDLPASLFQQHHDKVRKEIHQMNEKLQDGPGQHKSSTTMNPGSWGAVVLAGLPHLLMGSLIGTGLILRFSLYDSIQKKAAYLGIWLALVVICTLVVAWRKRWPLWSASWYLYGTYVSMAVIGLQIERFNLDQSGRINIALYVGWIGLCIIGYIAILRKSKMHALLSIVYLFPLLGSFFLEFIPRSIEGWLAIALGTLTALVAGASVRLNNFSKALVMVTGLIMISGLSIAYISEYQMIERRPWAPVHIPEFSNFVEVLALYIFISLGIIALPLIIPTLRNMVNRKPAA